MPVNDDDDRTTDEYRAALDFLIARINEAHQRDQALADHIVAHQFTPALPPAFFDRPQTPFRIDTEHLYSPALYQRYRITDLWQLPPDDDPTVIVL